MEAFFILSIEQLDTNEISTWLGRPVEITGVSVSTLIQVLLEGIEDVLYTSVYLNFQMFVQYEGIVELGIEIEEIRSMDQFVFLNIGIWETGSI